MKYVPTIGLEIHAELNTQTKMFCDCRNDPEEKHPNVNVCPICLGHPGTLPVINRKAVEAVFKIGLALKGKPAANSKFDRKNYFYPDLPKNYQISQYDLPLIGGGELRGIRITRIHLEEDAGRLVHEATSDRRQATSLVDFNRAGLPLMELVSEPDIKSAYEAMLFAKELQLILRYLGVSYADMEKGQMRVEANVSLRREEEEKLGTKVEVKNINSFKAVHDAIQYEIERQKKVLDGGDAVKQETRGWDDKKNITKSQRSKEEAHDYRYFPEPDLPPLSLDAFDIEKIKLEIPELPEEKRSRFEREYLMAPESVEMLVSEPEFADYFEAAVSEAKTFSNDGAIIRTIFNYLASDLRGLLNSGGTSLKNLKFSTEDFGHLAALAHTKTISSRIAKDLLVKMFERGGDPETIMQEEGIKQISDESVLNEAVRKIVAANPNAINDFKKGKSNALQFLIGQAMRELKGRGDPKLIHSSVVSALEKELKK
ncbi:MAG: Asp-tRNA(Asn)/Glu-tRNA(Gln) amidotransferase subunit GatB [Parcubacteria group bacterium]|nr:Asp-tRNA(Asn)/Glu-tRNA(Gln) amidotransferase subunit GatB [Parcubacteria group bacterium]